VGRDLNRNGIMQSLGRSAIDTAARLLERDDREAVLGDLAEMGAGSWRALAEILGLLFWRQAALWSHWQPWCATLALSLPGALLLQGTSFAIGCTYQGLTGATLCAGWSPGDHTQWLLLSCLIGLLTVAAWSLGFLIGFISRRTLWASAAVAALPCLYCQSKFHEMSLPRLSLLLFIPLAVLGAQRGSRSIRIKPAGAIALTTVGTMSLMIFVRTSNTVWTENWALLWPVCCLTLLAFRPDLLERRGARARR
jgi:hypothetical protein